MISHQVTIDAKTGKIKKHWDIGHIRHNADALQVSVGDTLIFREVRFDVTFCGTDTKGDGHRAWVGRVYNAKTRWKLEDGSVIAWGPKGIAKSFPQYESGDLYELCGEATSYLWLGND